MLNRTHEFEPARPIRQLLYAVKWVILAFILLAVTQVHFSTALVQPRPIVWTVVVVALITLLLQLSNRRSWVRNPLVSLIADIALVSAVTYFSDGIQSPFYPLYFIVVITSAVDFGLVGALICAAVIGALSLYIDTISPGIHASGLFITQDVVRAVPFLFLIALITGALRRRIRALDEATASLRAEQAANEREMEVAAAVQRAMLPDETPTIKGARIAVTYKPAREVGGDLYDFYPVGDECVGLIVADVSGKGVPAALLLSSCKYAVRESYSEDLGQMLSDVNDHICSDTADETFVTMLYGTFNSRTKTFAYVNAGHMPPMIVRRGEVVCADYSDPPLGISSGCRYAEHCLTLEPGDALVLYTDGVTDALSKGDAGIDAFEDFLCSVAATEIDGWGKDFLLRAAAPSHLDDITIVAVQLDQ